MDTPKKLAIPSLCALLMLMVGALSPLLAQDAAEETPEWRIRFENLAPTAQQQFMEHYLEATRLFGQKRIFECLNAITEAEKIFKENPTCLNLKGACYVEFRDFTNARKYFLAAHEIAPGNTDILFNLAEIDFVTHNWEACEKRLTDLLSLTGDKSMQMNRLIEFKILLCKIRLNKTEEVQALAKKYDFNDDSPFHYYAEAALEYEKGNTEKAESWLRTCRRIFRKDEMLAPWQDTMIEFGYISSFYGGDLEEAPAPPADPVPPAAPAGP